MIEEVVQSILEAEDVAKKRIAEAEQQAATIVANAEALAEQDKKQRSLQNKTDYATSIAQLEQRAKQQAQQRLSELNAQTDVQIEGYKANVESAASLILEKLL